MKAALITAAVNGGRKVFLAVVMALMLDLSPASAALAHGFAPHGGAAGGHSTPEGPLSLPLLPSEVVLGVAAFFGGLYALRRHRS